MAEVLNSIPMPTLLYTAALAIYLFCVKKFTSFSFVFVAIFALNAVHLGVEYLFVSLFNTPQLASFTYYAWYLTFGLTDFIFVGMILFWSKQTNIQLEIVSKALIGIYFSLGVLQIVRLVERLTIDSELMAIIYREGIPFANIVIAILLFGYVFKTVIESVVSNFRAL
ncbi:hypothetical protein [Alteromonas halophila]|uniref:Uncharacterized protein n=1 Tax=Alteromonas halophila TaxID=516698 RepID=A0A918MZN4_9ALTE|nr:hypothetical protein [Alteromonas halophila]GGW89790.1 hypothetical protein GCM10007391_25130 [Alteromonas halophila]